MLKHEIEQVLYKIYKHEIDIHSFEQWLYKIDDKEVDKYFGEGFYSDLIDVNYTGKFALSEVEKLICSKIPFNKFEKKL